MSPLFKGVKRERGTICKKRKKKGKTDGTRKWTVAQCTVHYEKNKKTNKEKHQVQECLLEWGGKRGGGARIECVALKKKGGGPVWGLKKKLGKRSLSKNSVDWVQDRTEKEKEEIGQRGGKKTGENKEIK